MKFFELLTEGGPIFMYPLFIIKLTCVGLLIYSFLKDHTFKKLYTTIHHLSLFALVWGFLGMMIGLIGAFDAISIANDVAPQVLAGGLKVGLLCPTYGMLIFLIARLGMLGLTLKENK